MPDGALYNIEYDVAGDKLVVRTMYAQAIEDYPQVMAAVIDKLIEIKRVPRLVVTAEAREYEYSYEETKQLYEIADAIMRIRSEEIISLPNILASPACDIVLPGKFGLMQKIVSDLRYDPVLAYKELLHEIRHLKLKLRKLKEGEVVQELAAVPTELCVGCFEHYALNALNPIREIVEKCKIIRDARAMRARGRDYYRKVFHPSARPTFMYTRFDVTPPANAELVERYNVGDSQVEIFRLPGSVRKLYRILPPEFRMRDEEYSILEQARRTLGTHEPSATEVSEPQRFRENIFNISLDLIREVSRSVNRQLPESQMKKLADILARYTAGLGILEILLADEKIQDVLVNSPIGEVPIYINHGDHLECATNITPSMEDGESWATRFRLQSGRPLDEANPVLDTELIVPGGRARVAAITRPLSPDGLGFAFRRHRDKPWTFPLFIRAGMIDAFTAGLMWFLIDGSRTMLIAGTRGSGKSSFLGACMVQIMPKTRIITTEDSVTGDCKLLYLKDGRIRTTTIGRLIDNLLHLTKSEFLGREVVKNPGNIKIMSVNSGNEIVWSKPSKFIRHKVEKDIFEVRTISGREIKVTGDHSLFTFNKNCLSPFRVSQLKVGKKIVSVDLKSRKPFEDEIVTIRKIKRFTDYVYDISVPGCENFICNGILAHNTLELPVVALREMGFNVERLKSRSVITHLESELPAEEALRTALRLGDSALIIGEVRSSEALALYEAMRIGALANVVAGTIHGESAYGVFDRVVHDLGVPPTSFKATDLILICNTIRSPDGLHTSRRVTELTEVRKHWQNDPGVEGGFQPLLEYSAKEDRLKPSRTLLMGESMVINDIANRVREWKANWEAVWENINLRAKIMQTLVEAGAAKPEILEATSVVQSTSQFHSLSDQVSTEVGSLDSKLIYERWLSWLKTKV